MNAFLLKYAAKLLNNFGIRKFVIVKNDNNAQLWKWLKC